MSQETIYLLTRADDIGSTHAANEACIDVFKNGIGRSVEIMAPCPWFLEAVRLLQENPRYDVGVHLTLTSEWDNMKWRPLSEAKSIVDEDGYFYRAFLKGEHYPGESAFLDVAWSLGEVERELRAQIEITLKHLPWTSHLSFHMGGTRVESKIKALYDKLGEEYGLAVDLAAHGFEGFNGFGEHSTALKPGEKITALIQNLETLTLGKWSFIDHPAYDTPEMRAIYHVGYEQVALDRQGVTEAWTNTQVKEIIERRGIKLVSYGDVKNGLVG
jgi:chitin disaccharide deacetylase